MVMTDDGDRSAQSPEIRDGRPLLVRGHACRSKAIGLLREHGSSNEPAFPSAESLEIGDNGGANLRSGLPIRHDGTWNDGLRIHQPFIELAFVPNKIGLRKTRR